MLDRIFDTIVAISSAPGHGAVAIVRLSGPDALAIGDQMAVIEGDSFAARPGFTRLSGEVSIGEGLTLPAVYYLFRAPRSYTRQDTVEIQTVGSPAAAELVREQAIKHGAIPALPGEFTARAFLNGAMDLSQAEAVGALIRAQTDNQLRAARRVMDGALSKRIETARNALAELVALVEADIDFAEEPIDFISPDELCRRLSELTASLAELRAGAPSWERLEVLPRILLLGPPNAGKSSLMNRLSGIERSICEAVAGTTRDILSSPIRLDRGDAILLDAAGIDQTTDEVLAEARAMALSQAQQVDLVCLVVDAAAPDDAKPVADVVAGDAASSIVAINKCDLIPKDRVAALADRWRQHELGEVCPTSAATGAGLDNLRLAMTEALGEGGATVAAEAVCLTERQQAALAEAVDAIERAISLGGDVADILDCAELLAFELREALDALGRVTGDVSTEDLLSHVFANFCIGK